MLILTLILSIVQVSDAIGYRELKQLLQEFIAKRVMIPRVKVVAKQVIFQKLVSLLKLHTVLTMDQHLLLLTHADKDHYMSKLGDIFNLRLTFMLEP
jgi:hypothetical protein